MVGAAAERSVSPPPAAEDVVREEVQEQAYAVEPQAPVEEGQGPPPAAIVE
jgi:hypothetical protein